MRLSDEGLLASIERQHTRLVAALDAASADPDVSQEDYEVVRAQVIIAMGELTLAAFDLFAEGGA